MKFVTTSSANREDGSLKWKSQLNVGGALLSGIGFASWAQTIKVSVGRALEPEPKHFWMVRAGVGAGVKHFRRWRQSRSLKFQFRLHSRGQGRNQLCISGGGKFS